MRPLPLESWLVSRGARLVDGVPLDLGDVVREWTAAHEGAALYDGSGRDRLLVTGNDRLEFVQGLCTNDVEKLPDGASAEFAFITPKGKLVADARITKLDDGLLFDTEPGRGAALAELFGKYRIHEDVAWTDVSDDLAQLELWGPRAAEVLGASLADGASAAVQLGEDAYLAIGTPFGAQLAVPAGNVDMVAEALVARGAVPAGRDVIEPRRIELGLGRYDVDWTEATNPLEAGLDRTLDYKKGCYVGQEVVAKATYIGHVSRRLVRLEWTGAPVAHDTPLLGGKAPGRVTSSARVPGTDRVVALGYVRRESTVPGSKLQVGEGGPEATVLGYPHRSKDKPV